MKCHIIQRVGTNISAMKSGGSSGESEIVCGNTNAFLKCDILAVT